MYVYMHMHQYHPMCITLVYFGLNIHRITWISIYLHSIESSVHCRYVYNLFGIVLYCILLRAPYLDRHLCSKTMQKHYTHHVPKP